ncbi:MAG: phytoene desaturase family protein [Bacteroidales bacterium]|jgi:phytoene desaturase
MDKRIAVIGAGLSGLCSAIRLAKAGYKVTLYEKNKSAGGKIEELKGKGFRFDTGASILTLPGLITELFEYTGEDVTDYITLKKLEVNSRFFYPDGTVIDAFHDNERFASAVETITGVSRKKILKFLKRSQRLYELTSEIFLFRPFQNIRSILFLQAIRLILNISLLSLFKTMHRLNKKWFPDARIIQLFDRYATYNGSDPYRAPATLSVITHLEHNIGSYLPEKGMYDLIKGLVSLATKLGVEFRFNACVEEILVNNRTVTGIKFNGTIHDYSIIVNNTDVFYTYKELLKNNVNPGRIFKHELSSSCFIFYWGVKKQFRDLKIHNILFSGNYREEFEAVFGKKELYEDPSIYIYISSKMCKKDAPDGCENWLVMINSPVDCGQNSNEQLRYARNTILRKINRMLKTDLEKYIVFEKYSTPGTVEKWTNSYRGALYGPATSSVFSTFQRHANFKRSVKGLYFTGGTVHPGGGIPLCMASAKIVSELVMDDFPAGDTKD